MKKIFVSLSYKKIVLFHQPCHQTRVKFVSYIRIYPFIYEYLYLYVLAFWELLNRNLLFLSSLIIEARNMDETKLKFKDQRWSLQGKTALVTGGTRGIGSVILSLMFINLQILFSFSFDFLLLINSFFFSISIVNQGMQLWKN